MNILDIVLVILVVSVMALETKRGFGRAIFDFVGLLIAVRIVALIVPKVTESARFASDAPANEAIWYAILFVLVGGILLLLGKMAYDSTLISLDLFDPFLGGVLGCGVAVIIGHAIVRGLAISTSMASGVPDILANSTLGMEFYQFETYHEVIEFLSSLAA
ncbi:MAG TPA: CvpA family protein [Armatimonadota bacterium]|nr:CvpA family protein [Armatimonadota bacterium]